MFRIQLAITYLLLVAAALVLAGCPKNLTPDQQAQQWRTILVYARAALSSGDLFMAYACGNGTLKKADCALYDDKLKPALSLAMKHATTALELWQAHQTAEQEQQVVALILEVETLAIDVVDYLAAMRRKAR